LIRKLERNNNINCYSRLHTILHTQGKYHMSM